ncbi:MAG: hypothetical protein AAF804_02575, partial [Bacteroidota bacterium]
MKTSSLLFLSLVFFLADVQSQYVPLLNEDHQWHIRATWDTPDPPPAEVKDYRLFFQGDTLIQGQLYQQLWSQIFYHEYFDNGVVVDSSLQPPEPYALMREDSTQQRVYLHDGNSPDSLSDQLWFDFSLQVNDTVPRGYVYEMGLGDYVVTQIDTFTLSNGEKRRIFTVKDVSGTFSTELIEGVGSERGFLEPFTYDQVSGLFGGENIECQQKGEVNVFGSCQRIASVPSALNPEPIKVFPNPFATHI